MSAPVLAVRPDGTARALPCTYEGIKDGLDGATFDFIRISEAAGFYIDDNGMNENQPLNVPASMFAGRPLFGAVVLTAADTDEEGETLPPEMVDVALLGAFAEAWTRVLAVAAEYGQDLTVLPTPDTLPPPRVIAIEGSLEDFINQLRGGAL